MAKQIIAATILPLGHVTTQSHTKEMCCSEPFRGPDARLRATPGYHLVNGFKH